MEYLVHITTEGERWDQLAWRYYGNPHRYLPVMQANPHIPLTSVLPANLTLSIPVLEAETATDDLPPWMR